MDDEKSKRDEAFQGALLRLVDKLVFNEFAGGSPRVPGTTEKIAMELEQLNKTMQDVYQALLQIAEK